MHTVEDRKANSLTVCSGYSQSAPVLLFLMRYMYIYLMRAKETIGAIKRLLGPYTEPASEVRHTAVCLIVF